MVCTIDDGNPAQTVHDAFETPEIIQKQIVTVNEEENEEEARDEDVDELEQVEAYLRKYLKNFASKPD